MDQKTPLDNKKTVCFADFARCNPAIHRLSVTPNHDPIVNPAQKLANNGAAKRLADDVASSPGSTPSVSVANSDRGAQSKSREAVAYEVQEGDTIEGIALHHFGSTVQSLQAANP